MDNPKYNFQSDIVSLNYVSIYIKDLQPAIDFYSQFFGPPLNDEAEIYSWQMGSTWLTLFPSKHGTRVDSNPCNTEFAIQVKSPDVVDRLYEALIQAGAKKCHAPEDTTMYESMRFACIDDPFGMRIDIYCPLSDNAV